MSSILYNLFHQFVVFVRIWCTNIHCTKYGCSGVYGSSMETLPYLILIHFTGRMCVNDQICCLFNMWDKQKICLKLRNN